MNLVAMAGAVPAFGSAFRAGRIALKAGRVQGFRVPALGVCKAYRVCV